MTSITESRPAPTAPPAAHRERPRVLVVDDEPQALRVFSAFLSASGMEVVAVPSGEQAIELLAPGRFDTVVSDLRMPGFDGFSLIRAARARDADLPVVVVTGCPTADTSGDVLELGAVDFLVKPVSADTLVKTVTTSTRLCRLARYARRAARRSSTKLPALGPSVSAAFARALETLYLAWQPIVRAGGGAVWGREAFARTLEPTLAAPAALFGVADLLGRARQLGRHLRRRTAEERLSLDGEVLFVNVHPEDLDDDDLLDARAPLSAAASSVVLELTDRTPLENVRGLRERVRAIRGLGYRVGIDDVGTGPSSQSRLALVGPDFVKLNASVVRGLDASPEKRGLARSMTAALHDLGIRVVATGVETPGEQAAVEDAGVDFLQGFLFGRPKPIATAESPAA